MLHKIFGTLNVRAPKRILVTGGGTGVFSVLSGLKRHEGIELTAIVTMSDDGGSTGILREEFGILPPGDVRRALLALSFTDNRTLAALLSYRFREGSGLRGHNFGNLMLAALERITGSFTKAINEAEKILSVKGHVLPVTLTKTRLMAELENGAIVKGETNIDIPSHDGRLRIRRVWLEPEARINPDVRQAILDADIVVIGPGDLYTSIMPNLVVKGFKEALKATRAKKVYVSNIMTKYGETNNFRAADFVRVITGVLGEGSLDYVLVNNVRPSPARLKRYAEEHAMFVEYEDLPKKPTVIVGDFVRSKGFLRHDPEKVAHAILSLL
jgi:uncharacterized cofD-like protein